MFAIIMRKVKTQTNFITIDHNTVITYRNISLLMLEKDNTVIIF